MIFFIGYIDPSGFSPMISNSNDSGLDLSDHTLILNESRQNVKDGEEVPNAMKAPRAGERSAFEGEVITWGPGELSVEVEVISQSRDEAEKKEKPW